MKIFKKLLFAVCILFLVGAVIYVTPKEKTVDFFGIVEEVRFDEENKTAYLTINRDFYSHALVLEVPYNTRTKAVRKEYDVIEVKDIEKGCHVWGDFKDVTYSKNSGLTFAKIKGKLGVSASSQADVTD